MGQERDRKRKRKVRRADSHRARERRKVELLELLGIREIIKGTPLESCMLQSFSPDVRIEFGPEVPDDERTILSKPLDLACGSATFDCPVLGAEFKASEYFRFIAPMMYHLHHRRYPDVESNRIQADAKQRTHAVDDEYTAIRAVCSICEKLEEVLIERSRLDLGIYFLSHVHDKNDKHERFVVITVHRHLQVSVRVEFDGEPRPAFRCGATNGIHGIKWCDWDSSILGVADHGVRYPVYVQSHAFDRLETRLESQKVGITKWMTHEWLWQSLQAIVSLPDEYGLIRDRFRSNSFLARFVLFGHHLGYVFVTFHEKMFVVRTFKLITMNNTPEGDQLYEHYKLMRTDKEYLHLDRLESFMCSDIGDDLVLCEMLKQCGCDHLLRILAAPLDELCIEKLAGRMREYLRIPPNQRMAPI